MLAVQVEIDNINLKAVNLLEENHLCSFKQMQKVSLLSNLA